MYTDEEINEAVHKGIFSANAVKDFRLHTQHVRNGTIVDEENFRLLSGFNDIFVLIASGLMLISLSWLGYESWPELGATFMAAGSWGLAEIFVRRKRLALPAIGLLLGFVGGLFSLPLVSLEEPSSVHFIAAGILATAGAFAHWRRFRVPITPAAGVVAGFLATAGLLLSYNPDIRFYYQPYMVTAGLLSFALAMYWDAQDPQRQSRHSDVAFWLHLLSAPLIVHPIFSSLGLFSGVTGYSTAFLVMGLYLVLALISIAVDRRAIMVSALIYVVYAMSGLLENYGLVSYSMALTGIFIGGSLLLLSAYWQQARQFVVAMLPGRTQSYLPALH